MLYYDVFFALPERLVPPPHASDCECSWCVGRLREGLPCDTQVSAED